MKLITRSALMFLCLIVASPVQSSASPADREMRQVTRSLPAIDRIELQKVISAELGIKSVEATKTIQGQEAQKVARIWRAQKFGGTGAACHSPAYAIKFFRRGKLIAYASLCWECSNISLLEPDLPSVGFNARGRRGRELLEVFTKAFP